MPHPPENSVHPATRQEWRAWLERNHARGDGVWRLANENVRANQWRK